TRALAGATATAADQSVESAFQSRFRVHVRAAPARIKRVRTTYATRRRGGAVLASRSAPTPAARRTPALGRYMRRSAQIVPIVITKLLTMENVSAANASPNAATGLRRHSTTIPQ